MNKARILLVAAATFLAAAFIGCSLSSVDSDSSSNVTYGSVNSEVKVSYLSGSITNFDQFESVTPANVKTNGSARTILPNDNPDFTDNTKYDYYLYGKTTAGKPYTSDKLDITFTDGKGTFKVPLSTAYWQLTLIAVTSGTAKPTVDTAPSVASLIGYATADLTGGNGTASFKLSTETLTSEGTLDLTLVWSNNGNEEPWTLPDEYLGTNGGSVTAELQSLSTGKSVQPCALTMNGQTGASFTNPVAYKQGTYNFVVKFKNGTTGKTSVWSDTVELLAKREDAGTVYVPNILGEKPANLTGLYATFIKNSEDSNLGQYKVHFVWDAATVVNERYFELEVADVSTLTSDTYYTVATNAWAATVTSQVYDMDSFWDTSSPRVDGSLIANSKECTMYLELGKVYFARIRAKNDFGESAWKYLTIDDAANHNSTDISADYYDSTNRVVDYFVKDGTTDAAKAINRYSITYNLNGGTYTPAATAPSLPDTVAPTAFSGKYVAYKTVDKLDGSYAVKLWEPKAAVAGTPGTPGTPAELLRGQESFKQWYIGSPNQSNAIKAYDTTETTPGPGVTAAANTYNAAFTAATASDKGGYTGSKNIVLYASYAGEFGGEATIFDRAKYFLYTDWVTYTSNKDTHGTKKAVIPDGATPGTPIASNIDTCTMTLSKAAIEDASNNCEICFYVTLPAASGTPPTTVIPDYYTSYSTKIVANDTYRTVMYENLAPVTGATFGTANTVTDKIQITDWENMTYTVYINGTVTVNGETITRTAQVTLKVTD